jgi:hypothetical protein
VKDPKQVMQTYSAWLAPLRESVEKWIKEGGTGEEVFVHFRSDWLMLGSGQVVDVEDCY